MNNEIKEILDKLKKKSSIYKFQINQGTSFNTDEYEASILLDYITNLQEENERLKELCNKYEEEHNTVFNLWKMKMEEMPTYEEKEDYKSRNEKAIEYVNTHKPSDTISFPLMKKDEENQVKSCFDYEFREIYQKELLNILKGENNE